MTNGKQEVVRFIDVAIYNVKWVIKGGAPAAGGRIKSDRPSPIASSSDLLR
jgi:hypothetical protein